MIATIQPLSVGNALRLYLEPPAGAVSWRVLRKGSDTFSGASDPSATVVRDGTDEPVFVDTLALTNEVQAFYRAYYTLANGSVAESATAAGTPGASYEEVTTDVLRAVRDRLEAGLKVEVQRGNIVNELGYVQVFSAAPLMTRDPVFPLVTVHLDSEAPTQRFLGEDIGLDAGSLGTTADAEGWYADARLTLVGWSLNADERIELRQAIRRVLIGNLPVFRDMGFQEIQIQQQDNDAVNGEFEAPVYQVMTTFSCIAPVAVTMHDAVGITSVTAQVIN